MEHRETEGLPMCVNLPTEIRSEIGRRMIAYAWARNPPAQNPSLCCWALREDPPIFPAMTARASPQHWLSGTGTI